MPVLAESTSEYDGVWFEGFFVMREGGQNSKLGVKFAIRG